jgi:hypothetical protein
MAARRVKREQSMRFEAVRLRNALTGSTRIAASDPLKIRREALDRQLREMRATASPLVEVID